MSKNLIFGEKAKCVTMRLYSWEKALVRAYVKMLRAKKREEILVKEKKCYKKRFTRQKQETGLN